MSLTDVFIPMLRESFSAGCFFAKPDFWNWGRLTYPKSLSPVVGLDEFRFVLQMGISEISQYLAMFGFELNEKC